ncbi:MAG: GyrI-like domain-containing protein [Oscillospiraceae bacterium]|nr:GyrI-like domain-containing protein [Oscillospiraceae bacterium]
MQPKIISRDKLYITGLTGNGSKTGEVWSDFDSKYNKNPFPRADECGYEIRYYDSERPAVLGKDIHVGFSAEAPGDIGGFATIVLPAGEYAVFDVYVAKGYDSGNKEMDEWLKDNAAQYRPRLIDGIGYIVECYNEKFDGGDKPDSIVEIWVPIHKI